MTQDRLAKWSAIAEILSSIAVVGTLIFLVVETRQNNALIEQNSRAIRGAAIQSLDTGVQDIVSMISSTQENAVLVNKALINFGQLTEEQQTHFLFLANALYLRMDTSWWEYNNGILPEGLWARERDVLSHWVRSEGGSIAWDQANVSHEFRLYVNDMVGRR